MGEAGYESRSANCAFAGRRLTGRVRMTVAAGAVAYRERSFAIGGGAADRPRARPRAGRAGRRRRPGGVPPGGARLRAGGRTTSRVLVRGRADRSACRWSRPSSTRRASAQTVPEVAEHLDGVEPLEKVCFSGPAPTASTSPAATRRWSAGSRPRVRLADRPRPARPRRRGARGARRGQLAHARRTASWASRKMEGAGAIVTSVETALFELLGAAGRGRSSRASRRWSSERLPAARGRHALRRRAGRRADADDRRGGLQHRRCPATRSRSPTRATAARSSSSPTR